VKLQKELAKASKKFERDCYLILPNGNKLAIKLLELPQAAELKQLLQRQRLILDLPGNVQAHMEPIVLKASIVSKVPLQWVQLYISSAVFPIQVQYQQDVLWLTPQIPMALYDF
jgi:hypothetical protein